MRKQSFQWMEMTMGVCYYPEHWDRSLWRDDLRRMKETGISVVRVAEFAWNKVEPEEGKFTYAFFDEFLDTCLEEKMNVIFGTPTATPPAWLTEKYPEVLNCREDGTLYRHGARRHYNYNSLKYQELSARIVEKLAFHYGKHPVIVGWQVDNELNCEAYEYHSEADTEAFRVFLKNKYGTLDALNEAWGTVFWNQTYTDWAQIYVPRPVLNDGYNPHMYLDYNRFISESTIRFCRMQAEIIRKYKKTEDFITTNGMFWNIDNHKMAHECLDVYTYDSYPSFAFGLDRDPKNTKDLNDRHSSKNLTEVRSICPHFGIMEQQSGANGWVTRMSGPAPRPGQMRLWAIQSVAHGADYISFFRWRTCTFGTEIYWHGILDYDNRDNRKLAEVKEFYQDFKKLDELCGSEYVAAFGILKDFDNVWDTNIDEIHRRVSEASEEEIFEIAQMTHTPYNVIYLHEDTILEDLAAYPVLFYPHPVIMTEKRAELLKEYVSQGGTLVIGCRSGYKQINGKCVMMPQPGLLRELTGSDVKEFTFVHGMEEPVWANWNGKRMEMPIFNDIMEPVVCWGSDEAAKEAYETNSADDKMKVLAAYGTSYYIGKAALIEKKTGKGRTLHLGSAFSRQNTELLLDYLGVKEPFRHLIEAPEGVELVMRRKEGREFLFVLNYQFEPLKIVLKTAMRSVFKEMEVFGELEMAAFGVEVFEVLLGTGSIDYVTLM